MEYFAVIFLSLALVFLFYLLFRRLFALMAESELRKCRCARVFHDRVEIFARGESLEYYLRSALFLRDEKRITVFVAGDDEESAYIAEAMQRLYDFEIRYI